MTDRVIQNYKKPDYLTRVQEAPLYKFLVCFQVIVVLEKVAQNDVSGI
jgi:hypothetical protein